MWFRGAAAAMAGMIAALGPSASGQLPGGLDLTAAAADAESPHVRASLLADFPTVAAGGTVWVGLRLEVDDSWHVYWKHPGDAGLAPRVTWDLPEGVTVSDFTWPVPARHAGAGGVVTHVLEGDVLLPATLTVAPGYAADTVTVSAVADWLVCDEVCLGGKASRTLTLKVSKAGWDRAPGGGAFGAWWPAFPHAGAALRVEAAGGGPVEIRVPAPRLDGMTPGVVPSAVWAYPESGEPAVAGHAVWTGGGLAVTVPAGLPASGLLVIEQGPRRAATAFRTRVPPPAAPPVPAAPPAP